MSNDTANTVATVLGVLGVLFMMAMAFGLFFENRMIALFLGVACFIVAGTVRTLGRRS
jgi:hypothetical protein